MSNAARELNTGSAEHLPEVKCSCGHKIFDGEVIRSRCVKIHTAEALCRCKKWVKVELASLRQ